MTSTAHPTTVKLGADDLLALKAALDVAATELRRGQPPSAAMSPEALAPLVARATAWVEAPPPVRATLTRDEAEVLAHYATAALRLRGYVVGRPEANQRFLDLYRTLARAARGERGWWEKLLNLLGGRRGSRY
ncbi:MAG: hypothetical protein M5U01_13825 [Ardenticatenaceae bacterium]|nr:hypothetical protein [Ardenticatenaceae bacterium]